MSKQIVWFDLETTSSEPTEARIVQMAIVVTDRQFNIVSGPFQTLLNPEVAIPKEATEIHGITNEMVYDKPAFKDIAPGLLNFFIDKDWGFYNGIRYDSTVLLEEFNRANVSIDISGVAMIDPMIVFHKKEPRDLSAALKFYTGKDLDSAHEAQADTFATIEIAKGQIRMYDDINSVEDIIAMSEPENRCDLAGKFVLKDGVPVFTFGKHRGDPIANHKGFLNWMLDKDFPTETKSWISNFLKNGK